MGSQAWAAAAQGRVALGSGFTPGSLPEHRPRLCSCIGASALPWAEGRAHASRGRGVRMWRAVDILHPRRAARWLREPSCQRPAQRPRRPLHQQRRSSRPKVAEFWTGPRRPVRWMHCSRSPASQSCSSSMPAGAAASLTPQWLYEGSLSAKPHPLAWPLSLRYRSTPPRTPGARHAKSSVRRWTRSATPGGAPPTASAALGPPWVVPSLRPPLL